jgi:hypothetical protein
MYRISLWKHWTKLDFRTCYGNFVFCVQRLPFPQSGATLAVVNPLAGVDHQIAGWFHAHLSQSFVSILHVLSELGSAEWIGIAPCFWPRYFLFGNVPGLPCSQSLSRFLAACF